MRPGEVYDLFLSELTFPTTREQAIRRVGDRRLTAPGGDDRMLAEVLARCPEREFDCATGLYEETMEFLGPSFVGRVGYDDRGRVPSERTPRSL
ncbi:hypothetical protein [Halosegnis sp.]|uniref:DUF5789 family protein n=1 Tax=Halosegnis sp. TaxID=2864959 RepID=UPI0035D48E4D